MTPDARQGSTRAGLAGTAATDALARLLLVAFAVLISMPLSYAALGRRTARGPNDA